jgi:adenylate kinase
MTASYSSLNLVLMGPPGSGKSTQARLLAETYQLPLISTQQMLLEEVEKGTAVGRQVAEGVERGELVPDRVMSGLILQRLDSDDSWRGFILDGYPRTSEQAGLLDGILAELGRSIERVVLIDVPEKIGIERLTRSGDQLLERLDDGTAANDPVGSATERFRIWRENAPKLVESYRNRGLLLEVDGSQPVDLVSDAVMQAVGAPVGA